MWTKIALPPPRSLRSILVVITGQQLVRRRLVRYVLLGPNLQGHLQALKQAVNNFRKIDVLLLNLEKQEGSYFI